MEQLALFPHRWRIGLVCVFIVGLAFFLSLLLLFTSSTPLLHGAHYLWLERLLFKTPTGSHQDAADSISAEEAGPFDASQEFTSTSSENGSTIGFSTPRLPTKVASPPSVPARLWPHETAVSPSSSGIQNVSSKDLHLPTQGLEPEPLWSGETAGFEDVGSNDLHLPTQGLDLPSPPPSTRASHSKKAFGSPTQCDISQGKWVQDGTNYPLYRPGSCPYVDEAFGCQENGRPDSDYLNWKWQPKGCELPKFAAQKLLERLSGKRMVFAGDSLIRNQWESMLCLLREGLANKSRMMEMRGARITKKRGDYVFKFLDYNARIEFYRSHFLVAEGTRKKPGSRKSRLTLRIDTIDKTSKKWRQADVLVFTTGHWWTHGKTARGKDYFQEGDVVHENLPVMVAFKKALETWGAWLDKNVNPNRTKVFFCGYSPSHFNGGQWNTGGQCQNETDPIFDDSFIQGYPERMQVIEDVISQMKTPVQVLNVTRLSEFRKDAHPSIYGQVPQENSTKGRGRRQDCSHWCLPGLPDTWNEILYSFL